MSTLQNRPYPLLASIKNFAWGKPESTSLVFKLANQNTPNLFPQTVSSPTTTDAKKQTPYSELWLGTHPTGPALILPNTTTTTTSSIDTTTTTSSSSTTTPIYQTIKSNISDATSLPTLRQTLGDTDLPFLFKILSISEALSIQSHPDKALAQKLHKERPDVYKDGNHKPELVVALTPVRALCGFREVYDVYYFLKQLPLLQPIFNTNPLYTAYDPRATYSAEETDAFLRSLWETLHRTDVNRAAQAIKQFLTEYDYLANVYKQQIAESNACRINGYKYGLLALCYELATLYPTDISVFSPLFLHYFALKPGQSIFLGPNIPHAYLYGDCVEVMACSDNVVRAGLTPKYKDTDVLLTSLTYQTTTWPLIDNGILLPTTNSAQYDGIVSCQNTVYQPPIDEFDEFMVMESKITYTTQTNLISHPSNNNNNNNNNNSTNNNTNTNNNNNKPSTHILPILPVKSILLNIEGSCTLTINIAHSPPYTQQLQPGNALYIPEYAVVTIDTQDDVLLYRACQNVSISKIAIHPDTTLNNNFDTPMLLNNNSSAKL